MEKLQSGSIFNIAWSGDGTQVALACSVGSVLIAHTIGKYVYSFYRIQFTLFFHNCTRSKFTTEMYAVLTILMKNV